MTSSSGILQIRLTALQNNWRHVAKSLASPAECAAVVKADAYGVGMSGVAPSLFVAGCRHFFVVTVEEGIALRALLPAAIIYVLGGCRPDTEDSFRLQNLIPVLYSHEVLRRWLAYCAREQRAYPCVIKVDTGMTRLGFSMVDIDGVLADVAQQPFFNPVIFMSHLACADEPEHPQNNQQLESFTAALAKVRRVFPAIKASLANSSGTFLGAGYHFDMVRIGAALYGINPQPSRPNPLRPVIRLKLPVLQIRTLTEPAGIGYGATVRLEKGRRLAVVAGGYADGLHRTLGAQPSGELDGVSVYAQGRMSMDSCVFDITDTPSVDPDYIQVISETLTLDSIMASSKSLGYEVLTSLGKRFIRQYDDAENDGY